jgi:hypothetical protein
MARSTEKLLSVAGAGSFIIIFSPNKRIPKIRFKAKFNIAPPPTLFIYINKQPIIQLNCLLLGRTTSTKFTAGFKGEFIGSISS